MRWAHPRRLCLVAALSAVATLSACMGDASEKSSVGVRYRAQKAPFVIGVWLQPSYSFAKWRERGINTIVGLELLGGTVPFADWRAELERQDLNAIREPRGALAQDARDPRLLAWMQVDGPDADESYRPPAALRRRYRRWKRAAPKLPVFLNLCGGCVMGPSHSERRYGDWIAASNWVSNDLYPITGFGRPDWVDLRRDSEPRMGLVLDRLHRWSSGKRQIQIVEASDFETAPRRRAATPAELRGMVWHAIVHGATGIVYFPQRIGRGFLFDAAPPRLVTEMTRINRSLARLAPVLLSRGQRLGAPSPFERAIRIYRGHRYTIVLNLSRRAARYRGRRYGPYEVRVATGGSADPL